MSWLLVVELLLVGGVGGGVTVLGSAGAGSIILDGACSLILSVFVFICAWTAIIVKPINVERNNNFFMVMCLIVHPVKTGSILMI